jgi:hypothetical protein
MSEQIEAITLPPAKNPEQEGEWLQQTLLAWLDSEFIPEAANEQIAKRATQIYVRQRMEGENDVGSLVIANAVSDLLLESLGIDKCCGQ